MKNLRLAAAAAIAGVVTLLSSGAAQAYPDVPNVTLTIPDSVIYGGETFSYTAKADVDCEWTVTYAEGRASGVAADQNGSGKSLSGSYKTKVVSKTFKSPITATCVYDDGVPAVSAKIVTGNDVTPALYSGSASTLQAATQDASASATVTLLPRGGDDEDDNGALPDTGGSNLWILVLGAGLVLAGGGALYASRRRHSAH